MGQHSSADWAAITLQFQFSPASSVRRRYEALTRSLQVDLSLALSVASRISMPCAFMFSRMLLSIHVFVGLLLSILPSILGHLPSSILVKYARTMSALFSYF